MSAIRSRAFMAAGLLLISITAGCGTRVRSSETLAVVAAPGRPEASGPRSTHGPPQSVAAAQAPAARADSPSKASGGDLSAPRRPELGGPARGEGVAPGQGHTGPNDGRPVTSAVGGDAPPAAPPQGVISPTNRPGSPIIVASVGTLSGPVGALFEPVVQVVQVWVSLTNRNGGLNGHRIEFIVYDDGGDPARHRAQVQEAVERRRVIAFLQNNETLSGAPSQEYIDSVRVPVVGGSTADDWYYDSPMYFPQAPTGEYAWKMWLAGTAAQIVPTGKVKLGTLVCAEAQQCAAADRVWSQGAAGVGFTHVYRARASLAQPDYTAECLNARNAGVEFFVVALDAQSIGRLARSCARQAYHPIFSAAVSNILDAWKDDPLFEGMVTTTNVFPWFQTGTPATQEFHQALQTYGGHVAPGVGMATGWVTAKMFEKAAAALPEPPTSEALLRGLWGIRTDTLGGLTPQPLTFVENQPAQGQACWFNLTLAKGAWKSPDGFQAHCR